MESGILAGLPVERILARYRGAAGNEIDSGKFLNPDSTARLVANAFGFFLDERSSLLPSLPGDAGWGWPASHVELEAEVRFPWSGGRHPSLDVLIQSPSVVIGVESKRFEPFRPKRRPGISEAYDRPVWGEAMQGYQRIRDALKRGTAQFAHLDAVQLFKHALGLLTASRTSGRAAVLYYL